MSNFEEWADSVKRQMVDLGMSSFDAAFAVEENGQWFIDQHKSGSDAAITADKWFNHHHAVE
jgi:hypothetical protein